MTMGCPIDVDRVELPATLAARTLSLERGWLAPGYELRVALQATLATQTLSLEAKKLREGVSCQG